MVKEKTKICTHCKEPKSLNEFSKSKGAEDGLRSHCRVCDREIRMKSKYGINNKQYEQLLKIQKECCAACGKHLKEIKHQLKRNLNIDHSHKTGLIRGLLCDRCNTGVGFYEDKVLMQRCKKYLRSTPRRMLKLYKEWLEEELRSLKNE